MLVDKQRISSGEHEQRRVKIEHTFLEPDRVNAENVASDYDAELNQCHGDRKPAHKLRYGAIERIDPVSQPQHVCSPKVSSQWTHDPVRRAPGFLQ